MTLKWRAVLPKGGFALNSIPTNGRGGDQFSRDTVYMYAHIASAEALGDISLCCIRLCSRCDAETKARARPLTATRSRPRFTREGSGRCVYAYENNHASVRDWRIKLVAAIGGAIAVCRGAFAGAITACSKTFAAAITACITTFTGAIAASSEALAAAITARTTAFTGAITACSEAFAGAITASSEALRDAITMEAAEQTRCKYHSPPYSDEHGSVLATPNDHGG